MRPSPRRSLRFLPGPLAWTALALAGATGCSSPSKIDDHWNMDSVGPRAVHAFTGYDADEWKNYREFAWSKKAAVNRTVSRHFLNSNPGNPFQAESTAQYEPRPLNSILPSPHWYIHVEGLAVGAIAYASGGAFVPVPIDSLLGTFEKGGGEEFFEGIERTFTPEKRLTASYVSRDGFFRTQSGTDRARARYSVTSLR